MRGSAMVRERGFGADEGGGAVVVTALGAGSAGPGEPGEDPPSIEQPARANTTARASDAGRPAPTDGVRPIPTSVRPRAIAPA